MGDGSLFESNTDHGFALDGPIGLALLVRR